MRTSILRNLREGDEFMNVLAALCKSLPIAPIAGDGRTLLQPIAVVDAARCLLAALESNPPTGTTYDLGGPERIEYSELMRLAARAAGARSVMVKVPMPLMRFAVRAMELVLPRAPVTIEQLRLLESGSYGDENSVTEAFGFEPASIRGGLGYLSEMGYWDAVRMALGASPPRPPA